MKKWSVLLVAVLAVGLLAGCQGKAVTEAEAKAAALRDAGLEEGQADFTKSEWDGNEYKLDFRTAEGTYEYTINKKGEITAHDKEILPSQGSSQPASSSPQGQGSAASQPAGPSGNQQGLLPVERAKEIALQTFQVKAADVTRWKVDQDWEHGTQVYEVEFWSGKVEYSCDIAAATGEVLEYSREQH